MAFLFDIVVIVYGKGDDDMTWKELLKANITKAGELKERLHLTNEQETHLEAILERFPMTIPTYYFNLIDWSNPEKDPIFRMSVPSIKETDLSGAFDTSGETDNTVLPGLQHKYKQTALILSTHCCAMYCRHCFRKRLVGISDDETSDNIEEMAGYVRKHTEISNILISGGDSFMNSNATIKRYLELFSPIDHLDLIRFGTRVPVVLPMRIYEDQELLDILNFYNQKKQIYVVTQFNHSQELTPEAYKGIQKLLKAGIMVKNQTVLLKGVNDNSQTLGALLKGLTRWGITPYYIFQCRPVSGVKAQFQVPLEEGYKIVEGAKAMQNGQGKTIRYAMSHVTGKIEILGLLPDGQMLFKYQQAKYSEDMGRIFSQKMKPGQAWLKTTFKIRLCP